MSVDYQLIAGIDSAHRAEKNEDGWYTIVRTAKSKEVTWLPTSTGT